MEAELKRALARNMFREEQKENKKKEGRNLSTTSHNITQIKMRSKAKLETRFEYANGACFYW